MQQHQLRPVFDVEAARSLKQAQQHATEGNLLQGAIEERLAAGAYRRLQFLDARLGRRPARFDMHLGDTLVVAAEEGEKVVRQIILVDVGERADDAEIQCHILAIGGDEDVARMHVGMKEAIAEHLGEEDFHTIARQLLEIDAGLDECRRLADGNAAHALHHHDTLGAVIPIHLGYLQQGRGREVAP